ncbi:hypothetical protein HELRODRAFT_71005, partial [Helobdella robusta]|uniref:glycogenin glucosyltransferase n=1 Tax=Helobdella robusta TaxID=6412 RepID=T1G0F5_HELRO
MFITPYSCSLIITLLLYHRLVTNEALVTLATNDSYGLGALTLGHSLKRAGTRRVLVCMITKDVSQTIKDHLSRIFQLVEVNILDSQDAVNLELLTRPDLGVTFTKLHCWRLTQFKKCVFLDADTLVLQNVDDLFEREELSAAADVGWPDCFNSGVFVYRPSEKTYEDLLKFALDHGSFDGGDQGLLNSFFSDWATKDIKHHLPFLYNVVAQSFYTYLPAFKRFGKDIKILHFIGANKPWMGHYHSDTGAVDCPGDLGLYCQDFLKLWWQIFTENVLSIYPPQQLHQQSNVPQSPTSTLVKREQVPLTKISASKPIQPVSITKPLQSDFLHKQEWESGNADYMGRDSFENIQKRLDS